MKSIPCDIVLLPEGNHRDDVISLSKLLTKDKNAYFTLEEGAYNPHMSLYMVELPVENIEKVQQLLFDLSKKITAFSLKTKGYAGGGGFAVLLYALTDELRQLQRDILEAVSPLRAETLSSRLDGLFGTLDAKKQHYLETYGYPSVHEFLDPHITLTRYKPDEESAVSDLPDMSTREALFNQLGLFEIGENGTCIRKIVAYDLD